MTQKITAIFGIAVLAAILLGGLTFSQTALAGDPSPGQVTICHKPGTPAEQTKEVDAPAVRAHLAHGDTLGPCGDGPGTCQELCEAELNTCLEGCDFGTDGVGSCEDFCDESHNECLASCDGGIPLPDTNGPLKLILCECSGNRVDVTDTICWDPDGPLEETRMLNEYCGALLGDSPDNCGTISELDRACPMDDP